MPAKRLSLALVGLNYWPESTGISPYLTSLAEGLAARGHDIQVLTARPHYPQWLVYDGYKSAGAETRADVAITRLKHYIPRHPKNLRRLLSEVSFGLKLARGRFEGVDAVVLLSPPLIASRIVLSLLAKRKIPTVLWVQDLYTLGLRETGQGNRAVSYVMSKLEAKAFLQSTRLVVIHRSFAHYAENVVRVPEAKISVIRNWTHIPAFDGRRENARESLGWGSSEIIVLHAGSMGVKQGLMNVVRAARIASAQALPLRFVLVGEGPSRDLLVEESAGLSNVDFLPALSEEAYVAALAAADVLLVNELPGVSSMAVPSKLTSYFSAGRPVLAAVAADGNTAAEVAAAGAGVRVDPADPASLVRAAMDLAAPDVGASYGRRGIEYVQRVLDEVGAIARFEQLLRGLVDDDRGQGVPPPPGEPEAGIPG